MKMNPNQSSDRILSIKELNRYIKMKLESDPVLQDVWIRGEISNFTHHSSGHMYFTLKDKDSRIKSIMFSSYNQRLPFIPKEGTMVLARGNVSVYERDGNYQFYVTQMQPDGVGSLYLAYEQLKKKLEDEGLFAAHKKKPLPKYPKAIGVITSPTGAAVRDIMITLQRRHPSVPILLFPVLVQGKQAGASIAKAIDAMNRHGEVDVLIVGRGGGSLEELWAFNEEIVARSIYRSAIPIISAVGHETDFTIADFVADLRAATPTAAAELAVPHIAELTNQLANLRQRMRGGLLQQLTRKRERLGRMQRSPFFLHPRKHLLQHAERLDRLRDQLHYRASRRLGKAGERLAKSQRVLAGFNPREQVRFAKRRTEQAEQRLTQTMLGLHKQRRQALLSQIRHLDALSPLKVMQRGYSLVYDEQGSRLVKKVGDVQLGDLINVRLEDGRLQCQVWSMESMEGDRVEDGNDNE
ncbi:exodeoxyribonuclease VII large subunit [Paenibacillus swuensis]|uniref:Exodeoxyribonuclease 7 large subunit n=1 Tax=Paenibacillus swuensis TaxID=1178515 RepID=A0A172TPQ9_9BACL|nr:exodeoxyribonuclease VII large subunit [Paenibacillus swuensis]